MGAALCQAPGGERESDEILRVSSLYEKQKPYDFCFDYIVANSSAPWAAFLSYQILIIRKRHGKRSSSHADADIRLICTVIIAAAAVA